MNKEHILQEIHRTASTNGGKPLAWPRFAAQTGIREADWLGKFWARWGDALQEAGFAPGTGPRAKSRPRLAPRVRLLLRKRPRDGGRRGVRLLLWDGKSKGTVNNVVNLCRDHKPVVVYVMPTRQFRTIKTIDDLNSLLAQGDSDRMELRQ